MGFMDFVKKMATGARDEENRKNEAGMREIFNACVPKGNVYKRLCCHMQNYTNTLLVDVSCQFEPVTYEPGITKAAKHSVSITQSSAEVAEFHKFFKKGLS